MGDNLCVTFFRISVPVRKIPRQSYYPAPSTTFAALRADVYQPVDLSLGDHKRRREEQNISGRRVCTRCRACRRDNATLPHLGLQARRNLAVTRKIPLRLIASMDSLPIDQSAAQRARALPVIVVFVSRTPVSRRGCHTTISALSRSLRMREKDDIIRLYGQPITPERANRRQGGNSATMNPTLERAAGVRNYTHENSSFSAYRVHAVYER